MICFIITIIIPGGILAGQYLAVLTFLAAGDIKTRKELMHDCIPFVDIYIFFRDLFKNIKDLK